MFINLDKVTPMNGLLYEKKLALEELNRINQDIQTTETERNQITSNIFRRFFQQRKMNDLSSRQAELSLNQTKYQEELRETETAISDLENQLTATSNPEKDLTQQLQTFMEEDKLFYNDFLEIEIKLKPEMYSKYETEVIQTFDIEDYSIEARVDKLLVTYDQSFASVKDFYEKLKEKKGLTRYTESEQINLKNQIKEELRKGQFQLINEPTMSQSFTVKEGEFIPNRDENRLSFGSIIQDLSTGILEVNFEDNYLNESSISIFYDEMEGKWTGYNLELSSTAQEDLNRFVKINPPDYSYVYQLGGDYRMIVEGGIFLNNDNTIEILKDAEPFSGNNPEILGRIDHLSKVEAKNLMADPFDSDFVNKYLSIGEPLSLGDPEPVIKINDFPEVLTQIAKAHNSPNMTKEIFESFEYAGRELEASLLKLQIENQERINNVSDQLKQLTEDQLKIVQIDVNQNHILQESGDRFIEMFDELAAERTKFENRINSVDKQEVEQLITTASEESNGYERLERALEQAEFELALQPEVARPKEKAVELPNNNKTKAAKRTPYTKEQVVSLYTRYLTGDKLTYDERSHLVAYDQKNTPFEQMQMRLEGVEFARLTDPTLNLAEKEQQLLAAKGESKPMQTITSKEYYELSKNERAYEQSKPIPLVHTMDRDLQLLKNITGDFMGNQLEAAKSYLESYDTSLEFKNVLLDFNVGVDLIEANNTFLFSYMTSDGQDVSDNYTKDIQEVIEKSLVSDTYPTLSEDTKNHMSGYLMEQKDKVLSQLSEVYDIQSDQAFQPEDYEKIFHYPTLADDREILSGIHHQRSEKIVDWAFKGTYTAAEITEYKNSHILNLQKKLIEGHTFYQIDEHMELMMNASKETQGGYKGILFDEAGDVDTFTVKDSKAAATKLFELGASPCSKSSLSFVKQFLADNKNQATQQHLIHNRVMQETYREETGRSMTGRG